ncbi:hypothetical protein [Leptospira stimsonii]|uniref:Uncharacterized protein n=1 Tax=Leptospira stimsonii TaxID=2202203 RepID=A0A396Z999_9LEPT|nr:hypothetical protein [Leptospira stimsonii]RHX92009.1 hypothetical protein DLM75_01905 [Leptospira stimsonii]
MADKTFIQAIIQAWKIGFPMYFPKSGIVDSINESDKILTIKSGGDYIYNVTWTEPVIPRVGTKCLLVARDNLDKRYTAFAFEKIDSLKTKIADQVELELQENKVYINFKNSVKITLNDDSLSFDLGSKKLKIKGDIEQDGDFKTKGKVEAEKEITAKANSSESIGLSSHLTDYTDTPIGPAVSSKPKAGT